MLRLALALFGLTLLHGTALAQKQPKKPLNLTLVDRVVAVVNDEVVLNSELMMRVAPQAFELEQISDERERKRRKSKLRSQVLDEMINEQLIAQAAVEAKLEVSAKEVETAIADLRRQNGFDETQLAEALRQQGYTMSSYRRDVKQQILRMRAVHTLVRPRVVVTDDDVRAKYDAMERRSAEISEVKLQHILIALPKDAKEEQIARAKDRAAQILQRARAGEDFSKLAEEFSDDPATRNTGGDLGWISRGSIATEWEVIVFAMRKGETRGPINGPQGFHVFHVADIKGQSKESFDKVKEKLRNEMFRAEMDKQTRLWLDELRKKAHVEIAL
jgi:parvulin-like peptidyl-prolyl isomerase